ncbi:Pycsar system effector family protein [Streptomyces sp. NPDC046215]|uniref:Pycsar effector protein domain-containing protein n=1 Tax=Streptomyces stramineus TaxID=173861 RepID=A0ABN0ZZZ4_9ACTN
MTTTDPRLDARLAEADATARKEIERSEPKSGALLSAFSIPLAVLVATVPGRHLPPAVALLATVGAVGLAVAVKAVLFAIRPHITGAPRGTYLYWATLDPATPQDLIDDLLEERRAEDIIRLAKLARAKHRRTRLAIDITVAAILALDVALLVALL